MNTLLLKEALLEELKFSKSPDLKHSELWHNDRPIPYIENAFFVQGIPVIYFSRIEDPDLDANDVWNLYRSVWSQGKVPLLYVITPQEIRVYNGYFEPTKTSEELVRSDEEHSDRLLKHLRQLTDVETARQEISQHLNEYDRLYLETGAFWKTQDGEKIKRTRRADQRLLRAMDYIRRRLLAALPEDDQSTDIVYALLGRSIFIRYLEDREILTSTWISEITNGRAHNYISALNDVRVTYDLFDYLSRRFNGDLFPVDQEERKRINKTHLGFVRQFLTGDDSGTGQLALFPYYDFTHIPIELISGIYDTFLSDTTREKLGAYYTPLALVDFVIEETLPRDKTKVNTTILDPTCGSGVFLVRAYQRLIEIWKKQRSRSHPTPRLNSVLSQILKQNIFGVDIQLNAVRIAAFSLYLAMLDHLSKEEITEEHFRFPSLNSNLICSSFLSEDVEKRFANRKFDRIIGNLPWGKSNLKGDALKRAQELQYPIGGKQLVQPLLIHAPKFCSKEGEVALLASTKATILVTSSTHKHFRDQFFREYQVRAVVNFSALRRELFPDSISPMIALFYKPLPPENQKLAYAVPKPSALSQRLGAIVLDATDIKFLEREELLNYPELWKIALWGNPRDAAIIRYLQSFPTLLQQATKYDWLVEVRKGKKDIPQGYIVGNEKTEALWLQGMLNVETDRFKPYAVETHGVVEESHFERPRHPQIYQGPLVLIRRSTCEAAFFAGEKVAYRDKITGIPGKYGQEHLLKWLVAYINSSLAFYYHFLTSTSWSVERGTIIHEEYKLMPFFVPNEDDPRLKEVLGYVDQIVDLSEQNNLERIKELKSYIDELIFKIYNLSPLECQVIKDTLEYIIPFFYWTEARQRTYIGDKAKPVERPDVQMLIDYAQTFVETAASFLQYKKQTLNAIVYQDGAPLTIIEFELANAQDTRKVRSIQNSEELRALLSRLDRLLLERHNPTFYTRRHVRIFDGPRFYIVRPNERYLWSQSQALADADGFLTEILTFSRRAAEEASR